MTVELSKAETEKLLGGISIPPRPAVLAELSKEIRRDDPNLANIARLVGSDVGVSAAMLKTVNSPYFGLRQRVSSVLNAVQILGAKNTVNIVTGLMLRNSLGGGKPSLERFWDSAEKVASFSAFLAGRLPRIPRDEAYTFSQFHDCGIPILLQKFPNYVETLKQAAGSEELITEIEDRVHSTNHAAVGHLVARTWYLPDVICEAILRHHDPDIFSATDSVTPLARTLIAINHLAVHFNDTALRMRTDSQWEDIGPAVLDHLGIGQDEYSDLRDDIMVLAA